MRRLEGEQILSTTKRIASKVADAIVYHLTHLNGDLQWESDEQLEPDSLLRKESFSPRKTLGELLTTGPTGAAVTVVTFVAGTAAISKIEQSLGLNNSVVSIISAFMLHPWR